ncbi:uncharacterized protein LOC116174455 isoform X3 [Photinus pyralis]|nr:uncharacterized protein LOC116174455 isoform X3 [Photinus pyralis]
MSDRSDNAKHQQIRYQTNPTKMPEQDLGPRKTLFVLVIVVGCFAVLWPKVFYPMLVGPTNQRMKPNHLDKGCCDVISDIDVNTIKIMTELCNTIIEHLEEKPVKAQDVIKQCRTEIYNKCGIDISAVLQEQVRLGRSFKQIVDEIRSFNSSFCLKYQFGLSPSKLGIPHRIAINLSPVYVKQERPSHLRPEMLHPALRERGSAIVQPYQPPVVKPGQPKFVDGRPGPVPGIRPPMGGAGHMVHSPKGSNSMGVIMPIYTVGIVIFFSYTLMKLLFKKKPEGPGAPLYPPVEPSLTFKKEVFELQKSKPPQGPLIGWRERDAIVNAMTALLDEVDQELEARRKAHEVASQKEDGELANGCAKQPPDHEQPSVKILGMEMTASCEGGQKWDRCESPVIPKSQAPPEPTEPPQEIFLGGILPAQSQLLVADSTVEEETNSLSSSADPPVILASKMTLSVISLDAPENEEAHVVEDVVDESKYTTAAAGDISDEEASDIVDEIEKSTNQDDGAKKGDEITEAPLLTQLNDIISSDINNAVESVLNDGLIKNVESVDIVNTIQDDESPIVTALKDQLSKTTEDIYDSLIESVGNDTKQDEDGTIDINEQIDMSQLEDEVRKVVDDDIQYVSKVEKDQSDVENKVDEDDVQKMDLNDEGSEEENSDIEEVEDGTDANSFDDEIEEIIIFEDEIDMNDDEDRVFISHESVQNIGDIIDEIITDGARRLEIVNDIDNNDNLEHSVDPFNDQGDDNSDVNMSRNNNLASDVSNSLGQHDEVRNDTKGEQEKDCAN